MDIGKKALKGHHYFIILVYVIVGIVILSLLVFNLGSKFFGLTGNYLINAEENNLGSSIQSFYIDKPQVLGDTKEINGQIVRRFISQEAFNLIFKPKTVIPDNSTGILNLNLIGNGDLYINDKLVIPNLENYQLLMNTEKEQVYVKKNILKEDYVNSDSALGFIQENYPASSVYYFSNEDISSYEVKNYKKENIFINTTFRGPLKLGVYVKDELDINFVKQDLNGYIGNDEYNILITDINGNVYFNETYEGDGEVKNTNKLGKEQSFNETISVDEGIYYINFIPDKNNDAVDSSIKNIKINSNKVMFIGNILPWSAFDFYTKVQNNKTIGFYYWWGGKNQTISIPEYREREIVLNKNWREKRYDLILYSGDYEIKSDVGYLWLYTDVLSPKPDSFFVIPLNKENTKFNSQDVLVIDKNYLGIKGKEMNYNQELNANKETKIKMKVISDNLFLKNISLNLEG
ncbi:MAG: hypothetical protein AABW91_03575 [Nanoarchaeota archaeon]